MNGKWGERFVAVLAVLAGLALLKYLGLVPILVSVVVGITMGVFG